MLSPVSLGKQMTRAPMPGTRAHPAAIFGHSHVCADVVMAGRLGLPKRAPFENVRVSSPTLSILRSSTRACPRRHAVPAGSPARGDTSRVRRAYTSRSVYGQGRYKVCAGAVTYAHPALRVIDVFADHSPPRHRLVIAMSSPIAISYSQIAASVNSSAMAQHGQGSSGLYIPVHRRGASGSSTSSLLDSRGSSPRSTRSPKPTMRPISPAPTPRTTTHQSGTRLLARKCPCMILTGDAPLQSTPRLPLAQHLYPHRRYPASIRGLSSSPSRPLRHPICIPYTAPPLPRTFPP